MPPAKRQKRALPSSELGQGDFAVHLDKKGRAVRKCRNQARESPFEDSAIAISDPDEDEYEERIVGDSITVAASRKRKRSHSPEFNLPSDAAGILLSDTESSVDNDVQVMPNTAPAGHHTVHLTVNIPAGHQGPITLVLDPKSLNQPTPSLNNDALTRATLARLNARSKAKTKKRAGFLDLPAELRNEVYRMVLVSEESVNFSNPVYFSRSGQLLATCRQVYEEGRSILYSENRFCIERRTQRYGSLWEREWRELGYLTIRKFMKSIGPVNTALIRHINMVLEDAVPCLNPGLQSNDERRFVNDDDLISVLRHLANYSELKTLDLHFHGRKRVDYTDQRFLGYVKRIKADSVCFKNWSSSSGYTRESKQGEDVKRGLLAACTRRAKKFD